MSGRGSAFRAWRTEKIAAEEILNEITQKLNHLKSDYEDQKSVTVELQTQSDSIRRVQREQTGRKLPDQ